MSEFELVELIQAHYDRNWVVIQFWGGVSLALIGASYFIADRFKLALLIALIALYTTFTIYALGTVAADTDLANEYLLDLAALETNGTVLAKGTKLLLARSGESGLADLISIVAILSVYLAAVGYAIYSFSQRDTDI